MKILAIDPGATTGWCLYDSDERRVLDAGQFRGAESDVAEDTYLLADMVAIERPEAHGATRPQVVDCAYVAGRLHGFFRHGLEARVYELTRREVCRVLTDAAHLDTKDRVKNDATAWAVLVLLHGEGSDKKPRMRKGQVIEPGGCLGAVKSHERAALAVAVAFAIQGAR